MKTRGLPARRNCRLVAIALAASTLLGVRTTDALGATDWFTGTRLEKRLAQPLGISWSGNPLREALDGLSRAQQVAVLIDRRVDPGQKLDLQFDDLPLREVLEGIARDRKLGVSLMGPVAYFGPRRASLRLRTIAALRTEEIRRLGTAVQRKYLLPKPIAWDDFATPRDLLEQLARQNRLGVRGADRVPHDLWAAADLPPLSLVDRLTLILIQFDLTFEVGPDGKTVSLVPLPEEIALARDYPGGPAPKATAERYALLAPEAQVEVIGERVHVKGLLEAHERIASAGRSPRPPTPGSAQGSLGDKRFTLRVTEKPVGTVLEALAQELKLDLRIDRKALDEAGIPLDAHVSLSVRDVTIDELLRGVTGPAGLRFRRRGDVVEILPGK